MPTHSPAEVAALWYQQYDPGAPLAQGDELWKLEILDAGLNASGTVEVNSLSVNPIILTQSCDLEHDKATSILTCSAAHAKLAGGDNRWSWLSDCLP